MTDAAQRRDQLWAGWTLVVLGGPSFAGGLGFLWERAFGIWFPLLLAVAGGFFLICGLALLLPGASKARQWVIQEFLTPLPKPTLRREPGLELLLGAFVAVDLILGAVFLLAAFFGT